MNAVDTREPGSAILRAYLPLPLIEHWATHPDGPPIWHTWLEGTLMHCDMSGFTAMSERLARLGLEGAELMAGVLNHFFDRMLGIAGSWGGLQMKFGGDAMLLFFEGPEHCQRAAACALEMQAAMPEFRRVQAGGEEHRLLMRAGMHSGRCFAVSTGLDAGALHYLLLGSDVQRAAAVEAGGRPGFVVASAESAALIEKMARLTRMDDLWRLRQIDRPDRPPPRMDTSAAPADVLCRYLMPPFARPLAEGREPHLSAEHRRVTVAFIDLGGVTDLLAHAGDEETALQVNRYMRILLDDLERHGGFLAASDAGEHGDKLIVLFGAPISSEHDEANALRFALDLDRDIAAAGLRLRHRIGISTGSVFAGEIGSAQRREYTVIGDSVNLAARLMTAAPSGQIYVSSPTADRGGSAFALQRLRPMAVKGKSAPVQAFRLSGESQIAVKQPAAAGVLLARDAELDALLRAAHGVMAPRAAWAFVHGEPGIGKSALIDEVVRRLVAEGWLGLVTHCQAHRSRDVFAAWQSPLRTLFGIDADDAPDTQWSKIERGVQRLAPGQLEFAPLVAELLSVPAEESPLLRYMEARGRRQRLTLLLRDALSAQAEATPVIFVMDDAHLSDEPSLELLYDFIHELAAPVFVLVTARSSSPPDAFAAAPADLTLALHELSREDARRLAATVTGVDVSQLDALLDRAQGNPLFVQELALIGAAGSAMPESVNDVIVARLDRLPIEDRNVLRAAAVAGATFMEAHLQALLTNRIDDSQIAAALARLQASGFTLEGERPGSRAFRHPLTQEVVYEALPFVERRKLHAVLAGHIESTEGVNEPGLLLHHYDRAGNAPKTVIYAGLSGDRAARSFANREAIEYYEHALNALHATGNGSESDRSLLLERIGQSLETQGRHSAAIEALVEALARWRQRRGARRRRLLALDVPEKARESALCRRVAVSYERGSFYDDALTWLDRALEVMPPRSGRVAAEVFGAKSVTLYRKGEYQEAIVWGRRSLAAARRIGEPAVIAYAENMLGSSYQAEGSLREAVRHFAEAVRLYGEMGDASGEAASNNNLGSCLQDLGKLDAARQHYEIAQKADECAGDYVDMAIVYNNIGEILLMQGQYVDAIESLERVLEAHRAEEELTAVAGLSYVNLCRCAMAQGDLGAADGYVRSGMRLLRKVGAKGLLTEARMQMAELHVAQGDLLAARRVIDQALKDARRSGDRRMEARGERIAGVVRMHSGNPNAAAERLSASAVLARRIGASYEEARALVQLARILMNAGAPPRLTGLRRAVSIFTRMGAAPELAEAQRLLGGINPAP